MKQHLIALAVTACAGLAGAGAHAAPLSQDTFNVNTTADLVALCGADSSDPLYSAAQNFCHGFAVGTYRVMVIEEAAAARRNHRLFCLPDPAPSRNEAIAAFVKWAADRPKTLAEPPTDGVVEYLVAQYKCK